MNRHERRRSEKLAKRAQDRVRPSPDGCAFCGAEVKLTAEHVFADWLAPYLPDIGFPTHTVSHEARAYDASNMKIVLRNAVQSEGALHNPRIKTKTQTLKIVCGACNNGWMSLLQEQVKPLLLTIISGGWPALSAWERRIIAAWSAMFTMVAEFADPNTQATTFADRERLRVTLEPPSGWYVWVGLHEGPLWTLGFNHFGWSHPKIVRAEEERIEAELSADAAKLKEIQSTGWVVGPAYFQTLSSVGATFTVDAVAYAQKHGVRLVWPNDGLMIERPAKTLTDLEADAASAGLRPVYLTGLPTRKAWEMWHAAIPGKALGK